MTWGACGCRAHGYGRAHAATDRGALSAERNMAEASICQGGMVQHTDELMDHLQPAYPMAR